MINGKLEMNCGRCLRECETENLSYFYSYILDIKISLCEDCAEDFKKFSIRFFREIQTKVLTFD